MCKARCCSWLFGNDRPIYEMCFNLTLSGDEVYYTASSWLVTSLKSVVNFIARKFSDWSTFHIKSHGPCRRWWHTISGGTGDSRRAPATKTCPPNTGYKPPNSRERFMGPFSPEHNSCPRVLLWSNQHSGQVSNLVRLALWSNQISCRRTFDLYTWFKEI